MITALLTAFALAASVHALSGLRARLRAARPETGTFAGLLDELALPEADAAPARSGLARAA